ncbi:TPA: UPF0175 family protein [bacterium]|nr:UPF0175 family protein [bacterium]
MKTVEIELEDELTGVLLQLNQPLQLSIRELIVLELYRQGKISSGKAGQILNMPRFEFIHYASRLGIPFFAMTKEEWETEKEAIKAL